MRRGRYGEGGPEPERDLLRPCFAGETPGHQRAEEDGKYDGMGEAAVTTEGGFVTEVTEGAAEGVDVGKRRADCRREPNSTWSAARSEC